MVVQVTVQVNGREVHPAKSLEGPPAERLGGGALCGAEAPRATAMTPLRAIDLNGHWHQLWNTLTPYA